MADLRRSTRWAGLQPGDPVQVDGARLRGASWQFVAHVTNGETGEAWVEVVGGAAGTGPCGRSGRTSSTRPRRAPATTCRWRTLPGSLSAERLHG